MVHFIWPVMIKKNSLPLTKIDIHVHFGHVRMYATHYSISWIIFVFDSAPNYTDKLLESQWVQIAPLSYLIYFYTATNEISWTVKLMLSRLLIQHLGTSMTF